MSLYNIKEMPKGQVFISHKRAGETLASFLERLRGENNFSLDLPMTYAGRLDPMAEGEMIVLTGECCKEKDQYLGRDKVYELTILLGVQTDTLDMLGIVESVDIKNFEQEEIKSVVEKIPSIRELAYPKFSSKTVAGKSLLTFARQNIPTETLYKQVSLSDIHILEIKKEPLGSLIDTKCIDIARVVGDFRQKETLDTWQEIKKQYGEQLVDTITISVHASSGSYMRSLAAWVGGELGVPALAYAIKRTKIVL